ncbi:MAG: hypothetical protein Solivirus4_30 [Solivirus sp.]|uniref:Holliday junction resolvase n=1 Tax=Solivirus sp. TaxID=2487772 RepID=A0A3G5AK04_9VIRU|nr:MAG: hypothetical protein Solivirus4_30 [Solivirus sp.]
MNGRKLRVHDEKEDYTIYCLHGQMPQLGIRGLQTTSIDVGIKNFAIRVERRHPNGAVEPIYFNKLDFRSETLQSTDLTETGSTKIAPEIFARITQFLLSISPILNNNNIVGIERQLAANYKASRVYQHVLTFFCLTIINCTGDCMVLDISPKLKSKMFPSGKGFSGAQLKAWAITEALQLLEARGDQSSIDVIKFHKKKTKTKADDLADTVIQMEALIRILYN